MIRKWLEKLFKVDDGWHKCKSCNGTGIDPCWDAGAECPVCDGVGEFYVPTHQEMG